MSERILWKEFRVGETIIVDVEDDDEIVFRTIEGLSRRRSNWPARAPTPDHLRALAVTPWSVAVPG